MRKYSVIVFDLGNVLIPFDHGIIVNKLNDIEAGLGTNFYNLYKENYDVHQKYERWELNESEFLSYMMEWTNHKVTPEEFCHIFSDIFVVNEDVAALLPKLKEKYQLVLLSNTNYIHQKYGWENYEFLNHFDKLVLSHEVGAIKPEPDIYRAVQIFSGMPPEEHIFIDDVADYVQGAKDMGWDAVQFTGYDKLVADFKERNIL